MTDTRPVAAYLRLSKEKEDSTSIAGQQHLANDKAKAKGWPEPVLFTDDGVSGSKDMKRPGRDDLERRIKAREFRAVIVKSADRLARSSADFHRLLKVMNDAGCDLVVIDTDIDTSTPAGRMMLAMLAGFAEFEAATTGARVKVANEQRRRDGRALGGPVAYGLRNVKRDGAVGTYRAVDPDQAPVVQRMVAEALEGRSLRAIAQALNGDGIPTPRVSAEASVWDGKAVRRVLTNPAIAGMTRALGDLLRGDDGLPRVDDKCVIVDRATFDRVQTVIAGRAHAGTRIPNAERLLLDGVVFCGSCGSPMRRNSSQGKYPSYACTGAVRNRCKEPATTAVAALEALVTEEYLDRMGGLPVSLARSTTDPAALERLRVARDEEARTLAMLGMVGADEIPALAQRLAALKGTIAEAQQQVVDAPITVLEDTGQTFAERWADAEGDQAARRAMLADALRVTVGRAKQPGGVRRSLEARTRIEWLYADEDADPAGLVAVA